MMPFPEILVILLLLVAHHVFCAGDKIADVNVKLLPGISDGYEPQTDIVELLMRRMHLLRKLIVSTVLDNDKILISCQTVYRAAAEILFQHLPDTGDDLVAVITSKFFIKILQSVNVQRNSSD